MTREEITNANSSPFAPPAPPPASLGERHTLIVEELLEYEGLRGSRALCHLLVLVGNGARVCVLGNFDDAPWCTTTNAAEAVATGAAERLGRDDFRVIECFPRDHPYPFSEVTLDRVPARTVPRGQVVIDDGEDMHTTGHSAVVRFANPRWSGLSKGEIGALLGEAVVCELRRPTASLARSAPPP
jgi:hypothetical protein